MTEPASSSSSVSGAVRLNKRMAELGLCSRREADVWIEQGWVKVNGRVAPMGVKVTPADRVEIDKAAQGQQATQVTILLNKPVGYVSGQAEDGHEPAIVLINPRTHWREDPGTQRFSPPQLRGLPFLLVGVGRLVAFWHGVLLFAKVEGPPAWTRRITLV